jgi:EAL domain-containing protein (putative c-di-GMP-specific phosphodiesterase class I)
MRTALQPAPTLGQARLRVLVVDDDDDVHRLVAAWLQRQGYDVETAGDGRTATDLLDRFAFDVVISDVVMPDIGGNELLRRVRQRDLDLPVLLMTARPELASAIDAVNAGALRYLTKPFTEQAVVELVAHAARQRRLALFQREALARLAGPDELADGTQEELEAMLAAALDNLRLAYQPILEAGTGRVWGHEALLRVAAPAAPSPPILLAAAMRVGRLRQLSARLRGLAACSRPAGEGLQLFVNLHPQELMDDALYASDGPLASRAKSVFLEITEQASVDRIPDLRQRLQELRRMGFRIALDDLGAGHASLASFAAIDPELVKIDRSLVNGAESDPLKRKMLDSLVRLCSDLGVLTVAEGVETAGERDVLVDLGCDYVQGFFFGRPVIEAAE